MNEVEKLYKNVGIKKEVIPCPAKYYGYDCTRNNWDDEDCSCDIDGYPLFTAEKQLEIIKLLSYYYNITISKNFENDYTFQCEGDDVRRYVFTSGQDFAEQIASFVNMCYELLPEEERKQIRNILE